MYHVTGPALTEGPRGRAAGHSLTRRADTVIGDARPPTTAVYRQRGVQIRTPSGVLYQVHPEYFLNFVQHVPKDHALSQIGMEMETLLSHSDRGHFFCLHFSPSLDASGKVGMLPP